MLVAPVLVKLARRGSLVLQGCDVYIGQRWERNGWRLPYSKWNNPFPERNSLIRYEEYVKSKLIADLSELTGKVLGCWCDPGDTSDPCHGTVLINLWKRQHSAHIEKPELALALREYDDTKVKIVRKRKPLPEEQNDKAEPAKPEKEAAKKPKKENSKTFRTQANRPEGIGSVPWPPLDHEWNADTIWIDEAGVGAFAGPLYVTGTMLLPGFSVQGIHDSKLLRPHEREAVYEQLVKQKDQTLLYHTEAMPNTAIDELGMAEAWQEAIRRIIKKLIELTTDQGLPVPTRAVLDGSKGVVGAAVPIVTVVQADSKFAGVGAASILCKVARDRFMVEAADHVDPEFGPIFREAFGYYQSVKHKQLLEAGKCTPLHRRSFDPLKSILLGNIKVVKVGTAKAVEDKEVFRLPEEECIVTSAPPSDQKPTETSCIPAPP